MSNINSISEYESLQAERMKINAGIKVLQERLNYIDLQLTRLDLPCQ